jgi:ribosome-associated protein
MIDSKEKTLFGTSIASQKKAGDIVVLDMRKLVSFTDYFLMCSGETDVQIRAIADAIIGEMKKRKIKAWHVEGYEEAKWVLLDYGDVVIHVFHPEVRRFYRLEKLWADAKVV